MVGFIGAATRAIIFEIASYGASTRLPPIFPLGPSMGKKDRAQMAAAKRSISAAELLGTVVETRQARRARERREAKK
jgi:hypothetical protein